MLERRLLVLVAAAALATSGCESCDCNGDGDADADADSGADGDLDGDVDGDGDADGDVDGDVDEVSFDVHLYEVTTGGLRGAPLEHVQVAVDSDGGRAEVVTGADGVATVAVRGDPSWFTMTFARTGYTVVTIHRATPEDVEYWISLEGEVAVELPTLEPEGPVELVTITVDASGVPEDAVFCSSAAPYYVTCGAPSDVATFVRPAEDGPVRVVGFVVADGAATDYAEAELEDALEDRAATLAFDGTPALDSTTVEVDLVYPSDPASLFVTEGVYRELPFPVIVMEPGTYLVRGGATVADDADTGEAIETSVTWFHGEGEDLLHGFAVYPGTSLEPYSYRWFSGALTDGAYDYLDVPRVTSPSSDGDLSSAFAWQEVAGAERYGLMLFDEDGALRWMVLTDHETSLVLPELPSGYDGSDWPEDGAPGELVVYAWQAPFEQGDPDEPLRVDRMESASSFHALVLGR